MAPRNLRDNSWQNVSVLEDEFDDFEADETFRVNRGAGKVASRHRGEYRRKNPNNEDGYGELDFA
ncbi:hypothetical protein ACFLEY_22125 [Bradyrhizobium sp. YCK136]|uniref:hypothetical protein n=1 Tax=Bradyrhizobium sp. YCK136 TaxID=3351346 RepID=UPI0037C546C0